MASSSVGDRTPNYVRSGMKTLTKTAIIATCASVAVLYLTNVTQAIVPDGKSCRCIISWHIPFYGSIEMPEWTWWTFIRIWLVSLLIPPILWIAVGVRILVAKCRPKLSRLSPLLR